MSNVYHLLAKMPGLERWELPIGLERMAQQLVASGRLRIDANDRANYFRLYRPGEDISLIFSHRELFDERLRTNTERIMESALSARYHGDHLTHLMQFSFNTLRTKASKASLIAPETEIRVARAVVQAAHPAVIQLLLLEHTEVFVSFLQNVGDMMDVVSWQTVGSSSGLQSTHGRGAAVYISCGGNPFLTEDDADDPYHFREYGNGYPSLARLIVIGGQELGHYADIIRGENGEFADRHSADLWGQAAKEPSRSGRLKDMQQCATIQQHLENAGMSKIVELERQLRFFDKQKRKDALVSRTRRRAKRLTKRFFRYCQKNKWGALTELPMKTPYPVTMLARAITDMAFNLAPEHEAYQRSTASETEAVACIEALARVPQQVNKWGHPATQLLTPSLYTEYYGTVIPNCIRAVEFHTSTPYHFFNTMPTVPLGVRVKKALSYLPKRKKKEDPFSN